MLESKLLNRGIDPDANEPHSSGKVFIKDEPGMISPEVVNTPNQEEPKTAVMGRVSSTRTDTSTTYLGDSPLGISFAKLMVTAVNFKHPASFQPMIESSNLRGKEAGVQALLLPPKNQAERMLEIYFAQSNAQIPILHREQFVLKYFEPIYGSISPVVSLASNFTSINSSILHQDIPEESTWFHHYKKQIEANSSNSAMINIETPQEFQIPLFFLNVLFAISSSIHHLEYPARLSEGFRKAAMKHVKALYASQNRLETLQGLLLLGLYGIMRPSEPGVWYTIGSVLRICVDLGLHNEDAANNKDAERDAFTLDMRRRVFWCAYSLDRQVCFYLGRPFGIPEESINTKFPSELDDAAITENNFSVKDYSDLKNTSPSYKIVATAMFRIRNLQAEAQKVLYDTGELPRAYKDLKEWKADFSRRLNNWKLSSPSDLQKMNCDFNTIFFNLNYNHVRLILHGLSPRSLKLSVSDYLSVADASKEVIKSYMTLLELRRINYTWVAVHNLFMAGTTFLYSVYHCSEVSSQTTLQQLKHYTSNCLKILNSLADRCEAAIHCRNTFEILSAAVIRLKYDPVFKMPLGSNDKISVPQDKQLGTQHLSKLVENLDGRHEIGPSSVKSEFPDLAIPSARVESETPDYQQRYTNTLVESKGHQELPNIAEDWLSNSYDLDKFFKELDNVGPISPTDSSQHSASNSASVRHGHDSRDNSNTTEELTMSTLPPSLKGSSNGANGSSNSNGSNGSNGNGSNGSGSRKLPSTREGQRVYNMIFQVPDEAIWEQFFNRPTFPNE